MPVPVHLPITPVVNCRSGIFPIPPVQPMLEGAMMRGQIAKTGSLFPEDMPLLSKVVMPLPVHLPITPVVNCRSGIFPIPPVQPMLEGAMMRGQIATTGSLFPEDMPMLSKMVMPVPVHLPITPVVNCRSGIFPIPPVQPMLEGAMMRGQIATTGSLFPEDMPMLSKVVMPVPVHLPITPAVNCRSGIFPIPPVQPMLEGAMMRGQILTTISLFPEDMPMLSEVVMPVPFPLPITPAVNCRSGIFPIPPVQPMLEGAMMPEINMLTVSLFPEDMPM